MAGLTLEVPGSGVRCKDKSDIQGGRLHTLEIWRL